MNPNSSNEPKKVTQGYNELFRKSIEENPKHNEARAFTERKTDIGISTKEFNDSNIIFKNVNEFEVKRASNLCSLPNQLNEYHESVSEILEESHCKKSTNEKLAEYSSNLKSYIYSSPFNTRKVLKNHNPSFLLYINIFWILFFLWLVLLFKITY